MRTKSEILASFAWTNDDGRTFDVDETAQMKILVEVLCDIRDLLSKYAKD